jgi:hypothetical protein
MLASKTAMHRSQTHKDEQVVLIYYNVFFVYRRLLFSYVFFRLQFHM